MSDETATGRVLSPEKLWKADQILEDFYPQSMALGSQMANLRLKTAQARGLESLVSATTRFSEILNFIKNQAGKEKKKHEIIWGKIAGPMLSQLEYLEEKAKDLGGGNPYETLELKLKLARGWVRQVVTHYLYESLDK